MPESLKKSKDDYMRNSRTRYDDKDKVFVAYVEMGLGVSMEAKGKTPEVALDKLSVVVSEFMRNNGSEKEAESLSDITGGDKSSTKKSKNNDEKQK